MVIKKKKVSERKYFNFLSNKTLASLVAIIVVAVVAILLFSGNKDQEIQKQSLEQEITSFPPEQIVARVNGEDVTGQDVAEFQLNLLMQGVQISEEEAIDEVIIWKLLSSEAKKRGLTVTTQDVEDILFAQLQMQGMSIEDLKQQIEAQGESYEDFIELHIIQYSDQISIYNLIDQVLENIPDGEIQETFDSFLENLRSEADIEYLV